MRGNHSEAIQILKTKFLDEKHDYQHESDSKIQAMAKQANKVNQIIEFKLLRMDVYF
jgi:hypothetical protein